MFYSTVCTRNCSATHQSHQIPGMLPTEGPAPDQTQTDHQEDYNGADVDPDVRLHRFLHYTGECEHRHDAEGHHQLQGDEAKHLGEKRKRQQTTVTSLDKSNR